MRTCSGYKLSRQKRNPAHPELVKPPEHPVEKGDSVLGEVKFGCVCTMDYLESCCCRNVKSFEWSSPIITVSLLVCPVPKCLRSLCQQYSWGARWTPGGSIQRHVSYFLYFSDLFILNHFFPRLSTWCPAKPVKAQASCPTPISPYPHFRQ